MHTRCGDPRGEWGDRGRAAELEWDGDGREFAGERHGRIDGRVCYESEFGRRNSRQPDGMMEGSWEGGEVAE